MRKLWLRVNDNMFFDLQGGYHINNTGLEALIVTQLAGMLYFTNISGLGFENNRGFEYIGNFNYVPTIDRPAQTVIAGTLNFVHGFSGTSPYEGYSAFIDCIEGAELALLYSPTGGSYSQTAFSIHGTSTYILEGVITKITKQELKAGILSVGFEFRAFMPWFCTSAQNPSASAQNNSSFSLNQGISKIGRSFDITLTAKTAVTNAGAVLKNSSGAVIGGFDLSSLSIAKDDVIRWCSDPQRRILTLNGADVTQYTNLAMRLYPLLENSATLKFGIDATGTAMTGSFGLSAKFKIYRRSV